MEKGELEWRVDTVSLLKEIADCGLSRNMGVLRFPINMFKSLLADVAQRATEINDPELNVLMLRLGLYEVDSDKISEAIELQRKLTTKTKTNE